MRRNIVYFVILMLSLFFLAMIGCTKDKDDQKDDRDGWSALGGNDIPAVYDMYADNAGNVNAVGSFMDESENRYVGK